MTERRCPSCASHKIELTVGSQTPSGMDATCERCGWQGKQVDTVIMDGLQVWAEHFGVVSKPADRCARCAWYYPDDQKPFGVCESPFNTMMRREPVPLRGKPTWCPHTVAPERDAGTERALAKRRGLPVLPTVWVCGSCAHFTPVPWRDGGGRCNGRRVSVNAFSTPPAWCPGAQFSPTRDAETGTTFREIRERRERDERVERRRALAVISAERPLGAFDDDD